MQRAYNPETNEYLFLVNNEWVKPSQKAANPQTGDLAFLVDNQWEVVTPQAKPAVAKPAAPAVPDLNTFAGLDVPVETPPAPSVMNVPAKAAVVPEDPMLNPRFITSVQAQLDSLPEDQRAAALEKIKQSPDAYGRAARVIEQRYAKLNAAPETIQKATDTRLEAQRRRFIKQGLRPEFAESYAKTQALSGTVFPDLQQMDADVVGEKAAAEAQKRAEELENAGFWERVGAGAASQYAKSGLGLAQATADLLGDRETSVRLGNARRIESARERAIPEGETIFEKSVQSAMTSLAGQAPAIALSMLTGASAPVLAQAALQQFGDSYGEGRSAGLSGAVSATRAVPMAAAEVFFERFGMTKALAGLKGFVAKNGVDGIPEYVAKSIASEIPSEMATTLTQYGIDALPGIGTKGNPNLIDLYKELEETLRQTVLQAGVTTATVAGGSKAAQTAARLLESKGYKQDTSYQGMSQLMLERAGFTLPAGEQAPALERKTVETPPRIPTVVGAPAVEPTPATTPPAVAETEAIPGMVSAADFAQEAPAPEAAPGVTAPAPSAAAPAAPTPAAATQAQPEVKPLEVFKNPTDNMQSSIVQLQDGRYSVTLQDLDSGETFPNARIFKTLEPAQEHARRIANLPAAAPAEVAAPIAENTQLAAILQNRNRSSAASVNQMRQITANPDYGRLGFSRNFTSGAPVVFGGDIPTSQLGKQDVAVAEDGRRIPVQYAVVDADALLASNKSDGTSNPEYGDLSINATRAIAGNGRVAGLQAAYEENNTDAYKSELQQDDLHGVSPDAIAGIAKPVLVRVMPASEITANIGDISNTSGTLALSPVEQAKNDLNRVDLGTLKFNDDGSITADAVRKFVQAMPTSEQGGLLDKGQPNKQAYDRLEAAIFAKAYNNEELIRLFAQAQDPEGRLVLSALAQVAPEMARLDGAGALDIRDIVVDAATTIINAKLKGMNLKDAAQQMDMTVAPDTRIIVLLFAENPRSNKAAVEALRNAASFAYQEASKPTEDMFGAVAKAERSEVFGKLEAKNEPAVEKNVAETKRPGRAAPVPEGKKAEPSTAEVAAGAEANRTAEGFELTGETEAERRAREAAAPEAQLKADEKAIADRERDMFQLQAQKAEPEAPTEPDMFSQGMARATEETTAEDRKYAQSHADDLGGVVVWQQGEYALVRGYGKLTGKPIYLPTIGSSRAKVDVESFTGSQIPASIKKQMIAEKNRLEKESQEAFEKDPFIIFDDGIAISKDIPEDLAGVIRGWKDLILPDARIYVSTIEDANKNKNKFNGPHRVIGSGTLDARNAGSMRRMEDGSYYILFSKSTSKTNMLETIAHEMGHVHEREYFEKATPEERAALIEAHAQWLKRQQGQTAKTLVENLRAHTTGKTTIVPAGKMADDLTPYWRSFGEWYADQTARWATSAKTPTTIVEKFFKRLGIALRKFYQSLKAQKYLPDETFAQYIEKTISRPIEVDTSLMPSIQNGFDFYSESQMTKEISDANPDSKSLHAAADLPGAKKKLPPGRSPELAAAAKMVQEGTMTTAEYDKLVNKFKPIYVYTEPLKPATEAQMVDALDSSKRDKVNPNIPSGHQVGLRLDIPAFNRKGVYVVTIHEKGTKSGPGKAIGYSSVAKVTNATFGVGNQKAALKIATGEAKDALQTVEGTYTKITPEEASAQAQQVLDDPSWTQIGLDPTRHSYFYDRYTSIPVIAAEEVLQIGNMVLGKNVTYGKKADFLYNIDSTPPQTKQQRITARRQMRNEKIAELATLRLREFHLYKRMREYGSTIETQRLSNELNGLTRELKLDLDFLKTPIITPENFLNQARNALEGNLPYKGQAISPEVFAVIRDAYQKTPWLLSGLRLSIKQPKKGGSRAAGNFAPLQRIVTLWSGTAGTEEPTTIRHELTHSMEQMMTPAQQKVVIEAWRDALGRAIKKHTDAESQKYFVKVLEFLNHPNAESFQDALDALPSYDFYQYINPSEFWAVNAEKLLAQHLGGAWEKFKKAITRLFEGLKNILGFNNKYAVHKVFEDIVKGQHQRISKSSLAGIIVGSGYSMNKLENLGDDERMLRKYNRPNTPQLDTSPMLNAIKRSGAFTKDLFKDAVSSPLAASEMMMNGVLRGITYVRNKNVWFGSGLNAADFKNYNGALRTSEGFVTGSVALDNAIRGAQLATEVIFRGGIKYDPKTLTFNAVKTEKGMAGVYKAEMKLKKVLGDQVGTDLIQAYLEAKRSRSIQNELYKRTKDYEDLKDALVKLKAQSAPDPKQVKELTTLMEEAQEDLDSIKVAHAKINMTDEEIDDFIARDEVHKELRDIMENWTAINQNMLKFWRQVGLLSEGRYKTLSSIEDYVPWNRIMDDAADVHSPLQSTTRKMTNIGLEKLFKRGKPTVITDFVVEPGQKKFKIQPASVVKAKINGQDVPADKMDITPDGEVTIQLPLKAGDLVVFTTNREIENVIDNMTRNVMRMTMNGLRQYAAMRIVQEYATRDPKGKIMVYPKVDPVKGRFNFIANGKRIVVEISDPLIAESIFGMETLGLKTIPILAAVANLTRRAITLSGVFQLKQVFKDAPTAALVTGVKNPVLLLGGVYKGFFTSLTNTDPVVDILHAAGIAGFRSPTRTPEAEIKQRLGVMNRNIASFVIRGLDRIGDASDMAQRVATYKRVLAETGDEAQALYQAANVINFNRHGSGQVAQLLVKTVPFMGAYANSIDVLFQALAGGGLKGMSRTKALRRLAVTGGLLATGTLIYCMLVGDDDEYQKLDDQTKLRNFIIPGTKIMLPMNTSAAYFFKAIPEMIYNKVMKEGTDTPVDNRRLRRALAEAARDMMLGPEPIPAAGKPFIEIALNHSFFTGREVTPAGLKDLEAAEQYTMTTSEFGKLISGLTGTEKNRLLNPVEADHLVRSLFGSAGSMVQWASNVMGQAAGVRPEVQAKESPLVGAFMRPEIPRGREDLFYDFKGEVEQAYKTMMVKAERLKDAELDKYIDQNQDLISMHDYVNEVDKAFKEINQAIRFYGTAVDKTISPKERRDEINELQKTRGEILEGIEKMRLQAGM